MRRRFAAVDVAGAAAFYGTLLAGALLCAPRLCGAAVSAAEGAAHAGPIIVEPAEIGLDATSNAVSAIVYVQNTGSEAVKGAMLRADDFVSTVTRERSGAQVLFAPIGGDKRSPTYTLDLQPKQRLPLQVFVERVWDAGPFETPSSIDEHKVAPLSARKSKVPFNVKLTTVSGVSQPLRVALGQELRLQLENQDPLNYAFKWQFLLAGQKIAEDTEAQLLSASGSQLVRVQIPADRFPGKLAAPFRQTTLEGTLNLVYAEGGGTSASAPNKAIPVFVALGHWPAETCEFVASVVALIVLVIGGVSSLFLTHALPNGFRRLALRRQLECWRRASGA